MAALFSVMPSNSIFIAGTDASWNTDAVPSTVGTMVVISRYGGRKFAIFNTAGLSELWIGSMGGSFSGWTKVATATPPQELALPVTNILNDENSKYFQTQEGIVFVRIRAITASEIAATGGTVIATLPVGFRPSTQTETTVCAYGNHFATVGISTTGNISVWGEIPDNTELRIALPPFVAAS